MKPFAGRVAQLREAPVRDRYRLPNWVVAVRTDIGLVRGEMQDAQCVLPDAVFLGRSALAFGVFDGLGGERNGREAAQAAVRGLPEALSKVSAPQNLLGYLNAWVRESAGLTTAVVALFPESRGDGWILSVGDSSAYILDASGQAVPVAPRDAEGSHRVTQCLGMPDLEGHAIPIHLERGQMVLLCTDGVDGVLGLDAMTRALRAADVAAATDELFAGILALGAPDNATVVLARRTG